MTQYLLYGTFNRTGTGECRSTREGSRPCALRRILAIDQGDTLVARVEDGRIVLEKREQVLARVRGRFDKVPRKVSLANELIFGRREEARREQSGE